MKFTGIKIKHIFYFIKQQYYLLTPLLVFISFPFSETDSNGILSVFAWVSLVPLIIFLRGKTHSETWKHLVFISLFMNFITFGWMMEFGGQIEYGKLLVLVVLIPAISVFTFTKFSLIEIIRRKFPELSLIIYPCIWLFIDFIQSLGYLAFPWVYWGYTQYQFDSLIQIVSITGIFGISWIMIFFNIAVAELIISIIEKKKFLKYLIAACMSSIFILVVIILGNLRINDFKRSISETAAKNSLKIAFVQSCISPFENWMEKRYLYLADLVKYSELALNEQPDTELLLWTESSTLETITYNYQRGINNPFEKTVIDFADNNNISLFTGEIGRIDDFAKMRIEFQNSAVLIDKNGKIDGNYSKIHLCPFGEWFPYGKWMGWADDLIVELGGAAFVPGTEKRLFDIDSKRFGALICYESMFPGLSQDYLKMGADFLVLITNDGWTDYFKGHMQHFAASKFRAIETGIYFLRAGNTGFTAVINPVGIVEKSIPILRKGYLTDEINTDIKISTFYSRHGDVIFYIIEIIFIIILTFKYLYTMIFPLRRN